MKSQLISNELAQTQVNTHTAGTQKRLASPRRFPSPNLVALAALALGCGATDSTIPASDSDAAGGYGVGAGGAGNAGTNAGQANATGVGAGTAGGAGNGATNSAGGAGAGTSAAGAGNTRTGCVIGSVGCICDPSGLCASGLTCENGACCDATGNCALSTSASAGGSSSVTVNAGGSNGTVCTPGVTGPVITDCGYPYTSSNPLTSVIFNESTVLKAIDPSGGAIATVRVFYNDEHALTLGVRRVVVIDSTGTTTTDYPVSALATVPGSVFYPQVGTTATSGDQSGLDPSLRPLWPVLFITDISNDSNNTAGDWQQGGTPYSPNAVYGTWKAALRTVDKTKSPVSSTTTPDADPGQNNWNLGSGADPVPTSVTNSVTTKPTPGQPPPAPNNEAYSAEVVWNLSLAPGHSYRVQVIVHDGDQNQVGGDSGEACIDFCAGTEACQPVTCADYPAGTCGQQSDHCGGTLDCGPCSCTPQTCEIACPVQAYGNHASCQSTYDESIGYVVDCTQQSGCDDPSTIQCWCLIG